jgi:type VI secretion system protein VasJ
MAMDISQLGVDPIPGPSPAGTDPSYEPEFEALQGEIDKLGMVSADGVGIDWSKVIDLASKILSTKAKHFLAAAYLGAALIKTNGISGLAEAARLLKDLTANYWDTMFPPAKRARARANALTWWRDQVSAYLETFETADTFEPGFVETTSADLDALDKFLGEKLEDAPSLREIISFVSRLPVAAPPPPEAEQAQAEPQAEGAPAAPRAQPAPAPAQPRTPAAPAPTGDPGADAKALVAFALDQLQRAGALMLSKDLSDPLAYRVNRLSSWTPVAMAPPAEDGKTMIPQPEDEIKGALASLKANRQFEDLVKACESRVPQMLFWLDLHRICAEALDMMGARYKDALDALALETALFVKRLPEVAGLAFADGTPFADTQTKSWLSSIALGGSGDSLPSGGEASEKSAQALSQAMELVKDKKAVAAVTLLQEALHGASSGKDRFGLLVGMAGLLAQAGRADLARPNVEEALRLIDAYKLEEWEPDTALRGLTACYAAVRGDPAEEARILADKMLMRVARLSPAAAMRLQV